MSDDLRDIKDGDWYWVQKNLIRHYAKTIRPLGIAVYSCLAALANRNQQSFPSQQYIASTLGYSRAMVNKTLKSLERHNLIVASRGKGGRRMYHLIRIRCPSEETDLSNGGNPPVKQG